MAKAGYLQSVALDFKLGFPSGTRTRDPRVSGVQRFFQPAVTTSTDWAKSLRLGSFSSGWTAALFRDPDKHERWKQQSKTRNTQLNLRWRPWRYAIYCVYTHALSCTEHMSRKRIWSLKWKTKKKKKKLAIYRSWPWISNCWEWDSNSGLSGIEPRDPTTRPRRLGANLRRDATSRLLFLNQSVLADFDDRKKKNYRI